MTCEFGACGPVTMGLGPGGVAGAPGAFCSNHPTVCRWLSNAVAYLKQHPISLSANEIVAAQLTYQASTNTLCSNIGLGASFEPTKALTVGIYNNGQMSKWQDVQSSFGYSFGANLFAGYQMSRNSSGTIGGPSLSPGIGISGAYTWGKCGPAPW